MLAQRRRYSRWRMSLILLTFLGLVCSGELTPINVPESSSSTLTVKSDKSQKFSSLNELSWQAWILTEMPNGSGQIDPSFMRRITPKSVFIAPALPACAEGYRADDMGRCVKSVNINEDAHIVFLLQRLNSLYANTQTSDNKNNEKKSTGPLQLNIPLVHDSKSESTKVDLEETFSVNNPVVVPAHDDETRPDGGGKTKQQAIATLDDVKKDTTLNEEETMLFHVNSNVKADQKLDAVIPIAEFVDETNDTNFSEVVDYKIPIDLKTLLNASTVKRFNANDATDEAVSTTEKRKNFTEMSPTLVLLISPTKLPNVVDDSPLTQNVTADHTIAQMSNLTSNATTKEIVTANVSDSVLSPTGQSTEVPSILDERRDNATKDKSALENSKLNESQEVEFYDEEDEYPYSTDIPDEEDSVEGEEILKHGEAGMMIPMRNIERPYRVQERQNQTTNKKMIHDTLNIHDQIMIRFNDSTPTEDKDEAGSNISSEVSIDGDLILETTLLDVNTERLQVTTKPPDVTRKIVKNNENDSKESFGKSPVFEPEVLFSQDAHGTIQTTGSHGYKQTEHLTRVENDRSEELVAASSSSESLLYDLPEEDPLTKIHTIDEKQLDAKESAPPKSLKDSQSDAPVDGVKQTTMNLGSTEGYARFPDHVRFPDYVRQQSGYVRFPSSEANSIHSPSYKQHSHYPTDEINSYSGTSTKSSVPVRQKPVYFMPAPSRKPQPDRVPTTTNQNKQIPGLLHFWSNMPLVRDPAIYPVDQIPNDRFKFPTDDEEQSSERFLRASASRRTNFSEMRPWNIDRSQKRKTPIGG